jgi:cell division protein FtsI/penicillin-binding protein 2
MMQIASNDQKRLRHISVLFLILGLFFLGRLFQRQILMYNQYTTLAQKQYYTKIDQPAKRGDILINDRDSTNLIDNDQSGTFSIATDLELFNVTAVPRHIDEKEVTSEKLAAVLGLKKEEVFEKINVDKWYIPPIEKKISKETADKVAELKLSGIYLEGQYFRFYPEKNFLSHVLGFVDYDGNGRYGAEEYYDGILKGEGGTLKGVKDNLGRVIKVEESEPGKDGSSVVLTIDRSIQYVAEKKLKEGIEKYGAEGGSIIIADPETGGILAMASSPDYDPNAFNEVATEDQGIFLNPAVSLNWEPGSIFKPFIVSAAISNKLVEPDTKPDEPFGNFIEVDGYEIHNALDKPYGFETVTQILENSDNVGMVWLADKLGNDMMGDFIKRLGFGKKTGIDLTGESPGQLSNSKKWRSVNRATISFGQGISATPLQVVQGYCTIANKGKKTELHVLDRVLEKGSKEKPYQQRSEEVMGEDDAAKVSQMLVSVVENGHGKKAAVGGYRVAGKTGTAQIPKSDGGYEEDQHIGSFAGFAPADNPKFVMLVKFDKPGNVKWAEDSAAPIFGEIADWLLNSYFKVAKTENQ